MCKKGTSHACSRPTASSIMSSSSQFTVVQHHKVVQTCQNNNILKDMYIVSVVSQRHQTGVLGFKRVRVFRDDHYDLPKRCLDTSLPHQECLVCNEISKHLTVDSDVFEDANGLLGSLDELERSTCLAHKSLVHSLQGSLESSSEGRVVPPLSPPFGNGDLRTHSY